MKQEIITLEWDEEFKVFLLNGSIITDLQQFMIASIGKDIKVRILK